MSVLIHYELFKQFTMKEIMYSKHSENIGYSVVITQKVPNSVEKKRIKNDSIPEGTVGEILKTYIGGKRGIMQSNLPALLLKIAGTKGSFINKVVCDSQVSDDVVIG